MSPVDFLEERGATPCLALTTSSRATRVHGMQPMPGFLEVCRLGYWVRMSQAEWCQNLIVHLKHQPRQVLVLVLFLRHPSKGGKALFGKGSDPDSESTSESVSSVHSDPENVALRKRETRQWSPCDHLDVLTFDMKSAGRFLKKVALLLSPLLFDQFTLLQSLHFRLFLTLTGP